MSRTCPHCGHILAGDDLVCPHCQEPLDVTQRISLDNVLWCSECGALIPEGLDSCPKCGHETGLSRSRRRMAMNLPEIESAGEGDSEDEPGVIWYGPGEHDAGDITLTDGQTLYID